MKLPNKVTSYKESVLSKFPIIFEVLAERELTLVELYEKTKHQYVYLNEYIEVIDCLYALGKIGFNEERETIYYVN